MDPALVAGLCLETGSATAHSAILARAMGIPAVAGLGPAISAVPEGTTLAVDGDRGVVIISPGPDEAAILESRRKAWLAERQAAALERNQPACTRDGRRIRVLANLNRDSDVIEALNAGAEGVGVLRTEFLFLGRESAPSEEEQFAAYRTIAEALGPRPLVIRTLDIGGDKRVPFIDVSDEANPFLGWRGIRLLLARRDLLRTQLRAILRAGRGFAVEVLLPMISSLAELRDVKTFLSEVADELEREGVPFQQGMKIGIMIEVPSAVAIAGDLAREGNRLSIGTNDLVQYAMAADRTNARVAKLADHFQPAVLRMIAETVRAGRKEGICVDVCGEMAADPMATPLLIGMGVEEFSVSSAAIPELKQAIRRWSIPEVEAILREALAQDSAESVREVLLHV
jgi:phosphocarrier protein FPr